MLSLFKDLKPEDRFVAFVATMILSLFGTIAIASMFFPVRSDAEIKQTVIGLVMLAAGYYLGSSAGKKAQDKVIADIAQLPVPPVSPVPPAAPVSTTTTVTADATVTKTEPVAAEPAAPAPAAP